MKIKNRMRKIKKLEDIKVPYVVWTTFGKPTMFGSQICFGNDNDYKSEGEVKCALELLVEEFGGVVWWSK